MEDREVNKYRDTHSYVEYLARKRNRAVEHLLQKYPETTDIFCCDSHYTEQTVSMRNLIMDYYRTKGVLGAAIYGPWRQRAGDIFRKRVTFSDPWGVPSLAWTKPGHGIVKADGVSGIHIFPVEAWKRGVRYGTFPDRNTGTETTFLARTSNLPIHIDMEAMFYRERVFSRVKCLRISLGIGTKVRKVFH